MSQAGGHLPTLSSHGWGCSHLLGATNLPEHYRVVWDPAHSAPKQERVWVSWSTRGTQREQMD